jgi:translation initiation factor 3 subunit B
MAAVVDIDVLTAQLGINWSDVNLDSIQLPPGNDFGIESDDESVYQDDQSEFDTGFGNIIVVDHLPVVPKEKFEKLEGVVKKIYNQLGVIKENGLLMPVDPDTKMTLGYCFIEFNTPQVVYLLAA